MHASKKPDQIRIYRLCSIFFVLLLLWSHTVLPDNKKGIEIDYLTGVVNGDVYTIDAYILYDFGTEVREALDHGVALQIDTEFRVIQRRQWIWDKTIASKVLSYRLEHHPLSGHYLVTNLIEGSRRQFQRLEAALKFLGTIKDYPLVARELLLPDNIYIALIRARLNIRTLPAPLRPLVYVSSKWRLASPWQEWIIQL
ncbi:MAG: DUF4390 domain-containing protein [Gammaproteobacteria bacterium]|nr:DUF4390 domain-containing protein [Gammaproteobacteria bacterium]